MVTDNDNDTAHASLEDAQARALRRLGELLTDIREYQRRLSECQAEFSAVQEELHRLAGASSPSGRLSQSPNRTKHVTGSLSGAPPRAVPAKPRTVNPNSLRSTVLLFFEEAGDNKTAAEVGAALGKSAEQITQCFNDMRRDEPGRGRLLEPPTRDGRWTRSASGREYTKRIIRVRDGKEG